MNTAEKRTWYTEDEYFAYEAASSWYAEYRAGQVLDMAGGSENYSTIISNLIRQLGNRLDGRPCRVHGESLRLRIDAADAFLRPDIWVICGLTDRYKGRNDTAKNPVLVIEVQSPSTTIWDHREKFELYKAVPSLKEYVLVGQHLPFLEVNVCGTGGEWDMTVIKGLGGVVRLNSLDIQLPLSEIYANVDFESES